jgi:hypothetical protein
MNSRNPGLARLRRDGSEGASGFGGSGINGPDFRVGRSIFKPGPGLKAENEWQEHVSPKEISPPPLNV